MHKRASIAALLIIVLTLHGCGFEPLYATNTAKGVNGLGNFNLVSVTGAEMATPYIRDAFTTQLARGGAAEYDLYIDADEAAGPLAVQIDATVTRYNYRLIGKYQLIERATGKRIAGRTTAIASFNVVNSQYSTLFAERSAREKAAQNLAELMERDILLRLADEENAAKDIQIAPPEDALKPLPSPTSFEEEDY